MFRAAGLIVLSLSTLLATPVVVSDCNHEIDQAAAELNATHAQCAANMTALSETMRTQRGLVATADSNVDSAEKKVAAEREVQDAAQKAYDAWSCAEVQEAFNKAQAALAAVFRDCNNSSPSTDPHREPCRTEIANAQAAVVEASLHVSTCQGHRDILKDDLDKANEALAAATEALVKAHLALDAAKSTEKEKLGAAQAKVDACFEQQQKDSQAYQDVVKRCNSGSNDWLAYWLLDSERALFNQYRATVGRF